MLEKHDFSDQDVDYAFQLGELEKKNDAAGLVKGHAASNIYKGLMLEKVFGGVAQRFENHFIAKEAESVEKIETWLDEDMCTCLERRQDAMKTVIRGLEKSMPNLTPEDLRDQLMNFIEENWIKKVFDSQKYLDVNNKFKNPVFAARNTGPNAFKKMKEKSNLRKRLMEPIRSVFSANNRIFLIENDD